jgi:hypothetical protein
MSPTDFYNIIYSLPRGQSGFPTKKAMSEATGLNIWNVKLFLKGLVKSGKIRMEGNWYKFNNIKIDNGFPIEITDEQAKDYIDHVIEENKHDSVEVYPIKNKDHSINVLRYTMLGLGLISASLLIYYISIYAKENLSNVLAYIRSVIIVLFSFTSFQAIILLFQRVKNILHYIGCVLFSIFWLVVVLFSMISTIAGQFQLFSIKEENSSIRNIEYSDSILREKELINSRNILLNQINPYLVKLNTELDDKQLSDIQYRITIYNKAVQKIDDELKIIRDNKVKLSNGKVIEQNYSFYVWLSGILKISSNSLQLFLYILPALFLDLIGPISFSIFLFLRRENES